MNLVNWWRERIPRERLILSFALVAVMVLVLYLALEPIILERNRMLSNLPQLRTDLLWMKQNSTKLKTLLSLSGMSVDSSSDGMSLSAIQSLVTSMSLQDNLDSLGPGPGLSIRVQFSQITFPELVNFLYRLKATNAKINSAQISRSAEQPGLVQASIVIGG